MNVTTHYARIFWQLLRRDIVTFRKQLYSFAINFTIISPIVYTISYGYIMPQAGLINPSPEAGTIFFVGSVLQVLIAPAIGLSLGVFFDTQHTKLLQYQMTFAPLSLIIFERIIFFSSVIFLCISPYFITAKWLLGSYLATMNTHWILIWCVLYVAALFFSAFSLFFIFSIKSIHQFGNLFDRFIFPLLQLGGLRAPYAVFMDYNLYLGIAVALNPMMQITEGLRKAMLGGDTYLPYYTSIGGALCSAVLCAYVAIRLAKKRLDAL